MHVQTFNGGLNVPFRKVRWILKLGILLHLSPGKLSHKTVVGNRRWNVSGHTDQAVWLFSAWWLINVYCGRIWSNCFTVISVAGREPYSPHLPLTVENPVILTKNGNQVTGQSNWFIRYQFATKFGGLLYNQGCVWFW